MWLGSLGEWQGMDFLVVVAELVVGTVAVAVGAVAADGVTFAGVESEGELCVCTW